jgi:inner membrane protein
MVRWSRNRVITACAAPFPLPTVQLINFRAVGRRGFSIDGEWEEGRIGGVDSITQAALGAAVGEAVLGKKMGNRAIGWGALAGTLPDLDVVLSPFFSTAGKLELHRGASHSILVMVLATVLLAPWLAKLWRNDRISKWRAGTFVFLAWSTHVLIDCFTVYGTSVFWPFAERRAAWNNLFIIDPLFTAPLIVSLGWLAFLRKKKEYSRRRKIGAWGLGLSAAYVGLSFLAKERIDTAVEIDLARRGVSYSRRIEAPAPFNILLWRVMVDRGDEIWLGYRSIFEGGDAPVRWTVVPRGREAFAQVADLPEARTLDWFSDGWWVARSHSKGVWIADLRLGELREWGRREGKVDLRAVFSWVLEPAAKSDPLRQIHVERGTIGELLVRMAQRIAGDTEAWEGAPRLAGIHGSSRALLPEDLEAID